MRSRPQTNTMILGAVERLVPEDRARMLQVAVAPPADGQREEEIAPHRLRGPNGKIQHADRVAALVAADDGAAGRIHDAPHAGTAGGLEDLPRADDVRAEDRVERRARTDLGCQVDDDLDALEGGLDGVDFTDVGAMAGH